LLDEVSPIFFFILVPDCLLVVDDDAERFIEIVFIEFSSCSVSVSSSLISFSFENLLTIVLLDEVVDL
jgi:hypothetical protein